MAKRGPRIAEADYLDAQAVAAGLHYGEWVRVNQYQKSHKVGQDGETAFCGHPLLVDPAWWEKWREYLNRMYDADPGEWFIAIERRVDSNRCTQCGKGKDWSGEEVIAPVLQPREQTAAEKLQARRNYQAVIRIARQLDAEIVDV